MTIIDPIPEDETAKVTVEFVPLFDADELPAGDGLGIGTKAPSFSLSDGNGNVHTLANYAGQKRIVLVFYRGRW